MRPLAIIVAMAFAAILLSSSRAGHDEFFAATVQSPALDPDRFAVAVLNYIPDIASVDPGDPNASEILKKYLKIVVPMKAAHGVEMSMQAGTEDLAWSLAYDLQAAMVAFQRTADAEYLDLFEAGFDAALAVRDDRLGRRDDLRGRIMPGWGTQAYSEGRDLWITWDAMTGMLLYPAAIYAGEVLANPSLGDRKGKADMYLAAVREGVGAFDEWWIEDFDAGEGFYYDPLYRDIAPLNHMNLLGVTHVVLCRYFQDEPSCTKARGLANFLRNRFRYNWGGGCFWEYWEGARNEAYRLERAEDVSHAFLNVGFAEHAYRLEVAFNLDDMKCMAEAFAGRVIRSGSDWAANIDGTGDMVAERMHYGMPSFVVLDRFDRRIAPRIAAFLRANPGAFPLGWLSYAAGPTAFAHMLKVRLGGRPVFSAEAGT